ncbi:MAG: radical SAM protein [Acetobacteraceae bacterium]|nr:radical SAM protein [Acetobacteraceae bacterium]
MSEPSRRGTPPRALQVHVTRRCNLRCLHCYSSSGPEARGELPAELLRGAIDDAATLGYGVMAVSGGEPLLYRPLAEMLGHARRRGLATAITTNGMLLDHRRLESLRGTVSFIAVSLDGAPDMHDQMRAWPGAFAAMAGRIGELRASGIPFGFLFTLTRASARHLDWVADFAAENGAAALQVHPLSEVGRAAGHGGEGAASPELAKPDVALAVQAARAAAAARERHAGRLRVVVDYMPWLRVPTGGPVDEGASLADLVSPLVVEADGMVVPLAYGFARGHAIGDLRTARLVELADRWIASGGAERFRALVRNVSEAAAAPEAPALLSWADEVRRTAAAAATVG